MTGPEITGGSTETTKRTGRCLCGAVRFVAAKADTGVGACHCDMCRRWSGGPLMTVDCGTDVAFEGAQNIALFSASKWAERGFCKICGSNLFYRLKGTGEHQMLAGLFDDPVGLRLGTQVFIDEKPEFYGFTQKTRDLTGKEIFAMFGETE